MSSSQHIILPAALDAALSSPRLLMKSPQRVRSLLHTMIAAGHDRLQVIADFDRTLTRAHRDGKWLATTFSTLFTPTLLPQSVIDQHQKQRQYYYSKISDPTMEDAEKARLMNEWWRKTLAPLVNSQLRRDMLEQLVRESSNELRENCMQLCRLLDCSKVPLLIYSAGISELVREIMRQRGEFLANMTVIANELDFQEGVAVGFKQELIHAFNKDLIFEHHREYFGRHRSRVNVVLMGDMMGDLRMAEGVHDVDNMLTIGFLNDKCDDEAVRRQFFDSWDMVLLDDQSMDVPLEIARAIVGEFSSVGE